VTDGDSGIRGASASRVGEAARETASLKWQGTEGHAGADCGPPLLVQNLVDLLVT
jgi:hypothetical protein